MDIMQGNQFSTQNLMTIHQMPDIRPGEVLAGVTIAIFLDRRGIELVSCVPDNDKTVARERCSVPPIARRIHTIEHVRAPLHGFKKIQRRSDAH